MDVRASGLQRCFAGQVILRGCDLHVPSGGSCAITGMSGAGKSTLLQLLAGLDAPTAGTVSWNGQMLPRAAGKRSAAFRRHIGWLSQAPLLDGPRRVRDNVLLPAVFGRIPGTRTRCHELLTGLGLAAVADQRASSLSGGQAMRCALARALLPRPLCLIADEPTGTLDSATADAIAEALLQRTRSEGITLILSTHDHDLAAQCDQHLHLHEGVLHASARPEPA